MPAENVVTAAVQDGSFQVIAYSNTVTLAADGSLAKALNASHSYYLAQQVNLSEYRPAQLIELVDSDSRATADTSVADLIGEVAPTAER